MKRILPEKDQESRFSKLPRLAFWYFTNAVERMDLKEVRRLLAQQRKPDRRAMNSALHVACKKAKSGKMFWSSGSGIEVVKELLKHGADATAKGEDGKTALDIAKERKNQKLIGILSDEIIKISEKRFREISKQNEKLKSDIKALQMAKEKESGSD